MDVLPLLPSGTSSQARNYISVLGSFLEITESEKVYIVNKYFQIIAKSEFKENRLYLSN